MFRQSNIIFIATSTLSLVALYVFIQNISARAVLEPNMLRNHVFTDDEIKRFQNANEKVPQDDKLLIQYIRSKFMRKPSGLPLRLASPQAVHYSQRGQSQIVDHILNKRKNGFFIDCGAADGERLSNSLFFEKERNWTGLLVEADPVFFNKMVDKRRNAYHINACLSPATYPMRIKFKQANWMGGIQTYFSDIHSKFIDGKSESNTLPVQCFPLYSMLMALDRSHIDYFSLDVEGPELDILMTVPLERIRIDVISVEYVVWGGSFDMPATERKRKKIKEFFTKSGLYNLAKVVHNLDMIFVRKDLLYTGI